jgi:cold shock CspA family protein/cytochrome c2
MQVPLQITFRNLDRSETVEAKVRERVDELERFYQGITSCRVVVEAPNRRQHHGRLYHVSADLRVPGGEIVVRRDPPEHHAHENIYVAVRDCFDALRRRLEEHVRRDRGKVETHEGQSHGRVIQLFAEERYGMIASVTGEEVYFHPHAVVDGSFERLNVGDEVRFVVHPGEGEKGPQASTVIPVGKHHPMPARPRSGGLRLTEAIRPALVEGVARMFHTTLSAMARFAFVVVIVVTAASAQIVPTVGDPKAGRAFALQNCTGCHVVSSRQLTQPRVANGPSFQAVANMRSTTEMSLHAFLSTPHPKMPDFILAPNDEADVIAYILSLRGRS